MVHKEVHMFGTKIANRTARGMAVGALILSLGATTFGGSANAAPLADETQDCSAAAHARNDAVHLLHTAWKAFDGDLKDLAHDARQLQHEAHKSGTASTTDARAEVANAKQELKSISSQAHADIQAAVELGTACKDSGDEDSTTTTTTTTTTTSTTAPSDATAPADSTGSAHTFDTSGLDKKYKDIVDQAIADMQAVVDEATKAVTDLTAAAESKDTTDETKVKKDLETAKADRETAKQDREQAKAAAKDKSKDKSDAKSSNSGKGNGKGKGRK
jgi:polyhydroxyalkanoate synthesis regulator phasin